MYETEPRCNEPRYNEILVRANTIQKPTRIEIPGRYKEQMSTPDKRHAKPTNNNQNSLILQQEEQLHS